MNCGFRAPARGVDVDTSRTLVARPSWSVALFWLACLARLAPCGAEPPRQPPTLAPAEARRLAANAEALVIDLSACVALDPEAAGALARFSGVLDLSGLTELGPDVAEALAPCAGYVDLSGVTVLGQQAAASLARCPGSVDLRGLRSLAPDAIRALAAYRGRQLLVSPFCVEEGTDRPAYRSLESIPTIVLDPNDVKLTAMRFRRLSDANVWLLRWLMRTPEWNGALPAVVALDAAAARTLAQLDKWDGRLPSLTALDSPDAVEIAKALATRKGPLSLPNLRIISPKTLAALIEKEDVSIPLIETLELIAEPDGSPTDDFVIPEGFQRSQRR